MVLLLLAVGATGCTNHRNQQIVQRAVFDYFAGDYVSAQQRLRPLAEKRNEDFVLNNVRLGSAALIDYNLDEAEDAFLRAYEVINSVGVNDGGRTLGAIFVDEKVRIWKGEPFERAMANFYLGLVYYMRQDYNNARAAFENALFKLRDYGEKDATTFEEQESNFAIASIMLGRAWQRLGRNDLAEANFEFVRKTRPRLQALADYDRHARSNLLLVVEFGYGPHKVTDFDGAIVGFAPHPQQAGRIPPPTVRVNGRALDTRGIAEPPIDLLAMAQDRRWQSLDTWRALRSGVGTGLIAGGALVGLRGANRGGDSGDLVTAAALIGSGLLLKATSQADVRQWEMLPRTVFLLPLEVEPGTHDITIEFPHASGLRQTWLNIQVPSQGEATYYFRLQRWNSGSYEWPPRALAGVGRE
jgi:tetratricopeptide (TPR) repeat protein